MKLMPQGDYYQWHCRRCNSGNLTLWMRFEEGRVHCRACQQHMGAWLLLAPLLGGFLYLLILPMMKKRRSDSIRVDIKGEA